ncbi:glycosyltransferase family A protein [Comamonas sp. JC664]|uniref:glycosyltransferase family 2 protein n=1 Tax=Comamonas sp. JC664 TaxID=2801917 RepID=UPI00174AE88B|nr:glycosyltransferase family A protein [Comamonas sp. JC664]MBL0697406.1 glycosyltransferase family 2 protein [Comamonas sp. JC664]GHG67546.1 hypothetical protein GCM10012319_09940 [Comamonas sp. KCTC 72670]
MTLRFSVIIPTYNRARLLEAALDSVFAQEEQDFEVLVVDDGSTDDTLETLARYGERVRVLQQRNAGPGAARNLGIQAARGEYVAFLDSDDLWFPWTLATYRRVLEEAPGTSVVLGSSVDFSQPESLARVKREPLQVLRFADYLASASDKTPRTACVLAVRTEALRRVGGFTHARISGEDYDLLYRMGTEPGFAWVRAPAVVGYRKHAGSTSTGMESAYRGAVYLLEQELHGRYPGGDARRRERLEMLLYGARHVSLWLLSERREGLALDLYRRALPPHFELPRWRYMLGFLPWTLASAVRQRVLRR